jgi:hypothetical protein
LIWDSAGNRTGGAGTAMTPGGLIGTNSSGTPTFYVKSSDGSAFFGGTLAVGTASKSAGASTVQSNTPATNTSSVATGGITVISSGAVTNTGQAVTMAVTVRIFWQGSVSHVVDFQMFPLLDGASFVGTGNQCQSRQQNMQNTTSGFAFTASTTLTGVWRVTPSAGTHTWGYSVNATYTNTAGTGVTDTSSILSTSATIVIQENLA